MKILRLATAVLCVLALTSCSGPSSMLGRVPVPSPTGPAIRLEDASDRLTTYADRIEDEVLAPNATGELPLYAGQPPECPGIGAAAINQFDVSGENTPSYYTPIKKWLTGNGFVVTEKGAGSDRTLTGHTPEGFTVSMTLRPGDSLALTFTTPCSWPNTVKGGPTTSLPKATPKTLLEARSIELACEKPHLYVYSLKAPPYRGPGPHQVTTYSQLPEDTEGGIFYLPDGWEAGDPDSAVSKRKGQLLVCMSGRAVADAGSISCHFDTPESKSITFAFSEADYDFVVLSARTGQRISTFTLPSTASDEESCPGPIQYTDRTEIFRGLNVDALQTKLRPLITSRR